MSAKITTPFGEAVPPAPRHSVTVHMGSGWDTVERYGSDSSSVVSLFKNAYPRMKPHRDIAQLASAVLGTIDAADAGCFLFSSLQSAQQCVEYATSDRRRNSSGGKNKQPVPPEHMSIRAFRAKDLFYAVVFPLDFRPTVAGFWSTAGAGVSSRFAEANLASLDWLEEVHVGSSGPFEGEASTRPGFGGSAHQILRERIVGYLGRAPLDPLQQQRPSADDVYLFPTGMAAICKPHEYMLRRYGGTTVLFGMAFMNTLTAFDEFGPGYKFFGGGSDDDLHRLEAHLADEARHGRKVQAIWAEFPTNPLLATPNLPKLRELADRYNVVLAVDDTIGSWANVDITALTDILVTSLTKSFNGYADAIAGSAILNPASPKYRDLKPLFDEHYVPELYARDAEAIERNSRDYLERTAKLNANAEALVRYLHARSLDPESAVWQVYSPIVNPSGRYYEALMRPAAGDGFTAGYGCVFSVELEDLATTRAFYDALNVHKSVHLGAPFTLAFAYTMCTYKTNLQWAAEYGLRPTQIRISAGLEDTETLLDDFRVAVEAADKCKREAQARRV